MSKCHSAIVQTDRESGIEDLNRIRKVAYGLEKSSEPELMATSCRAGLLPRGKHE